jgi:predicted AlkP superfamily phosphohydrolase/phosphomutase
MLSGMDAPGIADGFAHPPGIMEEISREIGTYVLEPGVWGFIRQGKTRTALDKLLETIQVRTRTAKHLMAKHPWDFFMVVYTESDKVQHHFWKYMDRPGPFRDAILEVYEQLDRAIAQLLEEVDEDTFVFFISDHGGGPSTNRTFYINRWLAAEGFLSFKKVGTQRRLLDWAVKGADRFVKKKLPRGAKEWLVRRFPGLRAKVESAVSLPGVDWLSTKAYSRENHPAIFINLKGREPLGVVSPGEEYDGLRTTIAERLASLVCPETGEKIVEDISFREDLFWGGEIDKAPDIVFKWKDDRYIHRPSGSNGSNGFIRILSEREMSVSESFHRPSGVHRDEGIFVALGPGIRKDNNLPQARLMDVAPTALYALGLPVPEDMDGRVLVDVFENELVEKRPVLFRDTEASTPGVDATAVYDAEEEKVIQERLRGLGYID